MQRYTALLLVLPLWMAAACGPDEAPDAADPAETGIMETAAVEIDPVHQEFFANLQQLCGETLLGDGVYPDDPDHVLVDTGLRNYISECTDDRIRIEIYRNGGEYWHGAWVLEKRPEGFHLFHDHLGDVRTEADLGEGDHHGYGGYASHDGTATRQYFHADEVTAEIIPEAVTNVWMMDMDLDAGTFVYYLERHEAPRFRAEMELVR